MTARMSEHKINTRLLINVLLLLLTFVVLFNLFTVASIKSKLAERLLAVEEETKPAKISLTLITVDCEKCFDLDLAKQVLPNYNVEIVEEQELVHQSAEAQALIDKYGIEKLPTLIVTGELEVAGLPFAEKEDAQIFTEVPAPYVDTSTGEVVGLVSMTVIQDTSCTDCFDIGAFTGQIEQIATTESVKSLDYTDLEAKGLITRYGITKVPTVIISKDIASYQTIVDGWNNVGIVAEDGSYVMTQAFPPYRNLETGAIEGLVSLTYITDETCQTCYDVTQHADFLKQVGLAIGVERTVDISNAEGAALVEKYNITGVPIVIISKDASAYQLFPQLWEQLGSEEPDAYVFRSLDLINGVVYKDLTSGELVTNDG